MVARDDEYRNPSFRHALQGSERALHESLWHAAPEQQITAVDHSVDGALERRPEGALEALEEVGPAAAALHARSLGQVEAEVGVGEQ